MPVTADRNKLVEQHLDLVTGIAGKLKRTLNVQIPDEDLIGYGSQGLIEAAERYEEGHGTTFTTFAYYRIRGAMLDGLRTMGWYKRSDIARFRAEERANAYLQAEADARTAETERAESNESPAEALEAIADTLSAVATVHIISFDAWAECEQPDPEAVPVDELLGDAERARAVRRAIEDLPEKERALMLACYFDNQPMFEAGAALGLSKSWASRLHARAVKLLRKRLKDA